MTYLGYVVAAYAVFVIVLAWDFVSPRLQIRRVLREIRQRRTRAAAPRATSNELQR